MFQKLDSLEERYEEMGNLIGDPEVMAELSRWQQYVKSHSELTGVVETYRNIKELQRKLRKQKPS